MIMNHERGGLCLVSKKNKKIIIPPSAKNEHHAQNPEHSIAAVYTFRVPLLHTPRLPINRVSQVFRSVQQISCSSASKR